MCLGPRPGQSLPSKAACHVQRGDSYARSPVADGRSLRSQRFLLRTEQPRTSETRVLVNCVSVSHISVNGPVGSKAVCSPNSDRQGQAGVPKTVIPCACPRVWGAPSPHSCPCPRPRHGRWGVQCDCYRPDEVAWGPSGASEVVRL